MGDLGGEEDLRLSVGSSRAGARRRASPSPSANCSRATFSSSGYCCEIWWSRLKNTPGGDTHQVVAGPTELAIAVGAEPATSVALCTPVTAAGETLE